MLCKSVDDVDKLVLQKENESSFKEALTQLKYYKSVNRGVVKGSLFLMSAGGIPLNAEQLTIRLKEMIIQIINPTDYPDASTSTSSEEPIVSKDINRAELKEKLLAKLKTNDRPSTKRKNPFPQDIVDRALKCTRGTVVRESTTKDIDELMEEEYRLYLEKGYTFYLVINDPPYDQLFTYPLKNEWDNGLFSVM